MIPNVYRVARLHGATAEVALVVHRLIRNRFTHATAEWVRIVTNTVSLNWTPRMIRQYLKEKPEW